MDVIRQPGRKPGTPKSGGRKAGTPNRIQKRDLLARIIALEKAVADLARKGWTLIEVGESAEPEGISFFDLKPGRCKWPLSEPVPISSARFCGRQCLPKSKWCAEHAAIAVQERP